MTWRRTPNWTVDTTSATATVRDDTGQAIAHCYRGDSDARDIAALPQAFNALHEVGDIIEAQLVHEEFDPDPWQAALHEILAVLRLTGDVDPDTSVPTEAPRKAYWFRPLRFVQRLFPRARSIPMYSFSYDEMEAALCVWEHLLECCDAHSAHYDSAINDIYGKLGAAEFRTTAIGLGRYCQTVYDLIPEEVREGWAYDWDVIPAILCTIDWKNGHTAQLPPGQAAKIVTRQLRAHDEPQRKNT